jgi:squalene-hopene/tetraprenyl-beta-curcumene cyclase
LQFLSDSIRDDGSWPIDTNLATWVTSLAVHALSNDPRDDSERCLDQWVRWHLDCQHRRWHPFTGARPGGWGWSDLSGAVPDGDDTPAAIIALAACRGRAAGETADRIDEAIGLGIRWLLDLQNRNGGWPTFCRGWGKLPFDRSSTDLTAHAIRAIETARSLPSMSGQGRDPVPAPLRRLDGAIDRGGRFLRKSQRRDGAWLPLWFGNQDLPDETNPIYGTSRVLLAASSRAIDVELVRRGVEFLVAAQNRDGGWGGGPSVSEWMRRHEMPGPADLTSTVEETALAVESLVAATRQPRKPADDGGVSLQTSDRSVAERRGQSVGDPLFPPGSANGSNSTEGPCGGNTCAGSAIIRGVRFLVRSVEDGRHRTAWPIGFYFAKLWYHERLYPLIFTIAALGAYLRATADE